LLDVSQLRNIDPLVGQPGNRGPKPDFWRTLDELADDPAFRERLYNEFPSEVEAISDPHARRTFLKLMGASLGLAGLTACTTQPAETIVPYVRQPEEIVPGRPLFYATVMALGGYAAGLLVESHEGRPTKIEGNPDHPDSLGATSALAQAAILDLYDPDRARAITELGEIRPWTTLAAALRAALTAQESLGGAGIRLLTESVSSPTLAAQIEAFLVRFPQARWHQWDPAAPSSAREGARLAFGVHVEARYRIDQADAIVALDSDFLTAGPGCVRHAREFASRRQPSLGARMTRLYVAESMPTSTGSQSDHRVAVAPTRIETIARDLAAAAGVPGLGRSTGVLPEAVTRWVDVAARDLRARGGSGLVIAGDTQPAAVHALAHAINVTLGHAGRTVIYTDPVSPSPVDHAQSLGELVADMAANRVDLLVIVGGNPAHTAPAGLDVAAALGRVPLRVHLATHRNETSELCQWHVPETHFLEAWSDARATDGTASIVQPLIAPLYGGKSAHELLAALMDLPDQAGHDLVREYWLGRHPQLPDAGMEFELAWRRWLHDGVIPGTALASRDVTLVADLPTVVGPSLGSGATGLGAAASSDAEAALEVAFRLDPSVLDGRFANNGWLQELPKPITKIAWENAVVMSPATAERLGVRVAPAMRGGEHGQVVTDVVELRAEGRVLRGPAFPIAGHADGCVTLHLGYGRRRAGQVGDGLGFDANVLRTLERPFIATGVAVARTGDRQSLACTQYHHLLEGRGLIRAVTLADFTRDPHVVHEGHHTPPLTLTLHPEHEYTGYKWGMAIDVNVCTGCNACVMGCQSENNIAVVGRDQVLRGREMHWLRVDTYQRGPVENPERFFQPVPCMHCENAPCEVVCPVNATVHSHEGLNDMVYNRCVGTRYCANNCPYKVRRFNYHLYSDWDTPSLQLMRNPDVTVRSRGVMEKCTYCVQRINAAKIASETEDRTIRDGEIRTACQAACPSDAIVFGNLNDPESRVARLKAEERNYAILADLNTRPRTTYLAAVRNLNPDLEAQEANPASTVGMR
jgi:molybdopterin-containing oxidoreductase family iron-sulfur binding subunit